MVIARKLGPREDKGGRRDQGLTLVVVPKEAVVGDDGEAEG